MIAICRLELNNIDDVSLSTDNNAIRVGIRIADTAQYNIIDNNNVQWENVQVIIVCLYCCRTSIYFFVYSVIINRLHI
jgi:hypothetical protein